MLNGLLASSKCENPRCPHPPRGFSFLSPARGEFLFQGMKLCDLDCLQTAIEDHVQRLLANQPAHPPKQHRIPLGLLLLERGVITNEVLRASLKAQRESGKGKIGEWLVKSGELRQQEITAARSQQWSLPVFPMAGKRSYLECAALVPHALLEASRMIPVHFVKAARYLYVGFGDGVDYPALHALESMLECRAEACIADESGIDEVLEELRSRSRPTEVLFEERSCPSEIAAIACSYAAKLAARTVRLVLCGDYLWMRLNPDSTPTDLLFRVSD